MTTKVKAQEVLRDREGGLRVDSKGYIQWDWYKGEDIIIPVKENYKRYWLYNKGKIILDGVTKEEYTAKIIELAKDKGSNPNMTIADNKFYTVATNASYVEKLGYITQSEILNTYKIDQKRQKDEYEYRRLELKKDLLKTHGLDGHPKADKAYKMAQNLADGGSIIGIQDYLEDIADLLLSDD